MSGLYFICSARVQDHLVRRRTGYIEYQVGKIRAYVREEHNSRELGHRVDQRIRISPRFLEDVKSVASDPEATFFFLELRNREAVEEAVERGLKLPLARSAEGWLGIDSERRAAVDL